MLIAPRGEEEHDWTAVTEHFTALRRLDRLEDIANIVAFVTSDDAHWLTSATLPANGSMATTPATIAAFARWHTSISPGEGVGCAERY